MPNTSHRLPLADVQFSIGLVAGLCFVGVVNLLPAVAEPNSAVNAA
jgi:hypothetical protein